MPKKTIKKVSKVKKVKEEKPIEKVIEAPKVNDIPAPMILVAPVTEFPKNFNPSYAQRVLADFVYEGSRFIIYIKKDERK